MAYLVKNTTQDRSKAHLHRVATQFVYEPSIAGQVLRAGMTVEISDDQYDRNRHMFDSWAKKGMVQLTKKEGPSPVAEVPAETSSPVTDQVAPEHSFLPMTDDAVAERVATHEKTFSDSFPEPPSEPKKPVGKKKMF
jgi:hypothetical protein